MSVPVKFAAGVIGASGGGNLMASPDGRFVTVQQGDGNLVTYDTQIGPVGTIKAAIWSAWDGKL